MSTFTLDEPVDVRPYATRINGADAVIGDTQRGVYLTIPVEGLDILESLSAGLTVGEAVRRFEDRHDFSPDIDDFLEALADDGFVAPGGTTAEVADHEGHRHRRVWNLEWLSPRAAQRLLSWPTWVIGSAVFALAVVCGFNDPGTLPTLAAVDLTNTAYLWLLYFFGLTGVYLHELGHVVGARAAGMSATLKVGNQMSNMVAETDISAMWLTTKRQRYVALFIGPFIDLFFGSLLMIMLWADRHHLIALPDGVRIVGLAVLMTYFIRLNWQFFVFVRTDFYYMVATALGAPSLMADTRAYMRNLYRGLRGRTLIDQTALRKREIWAIRIFIPVWLFGRVVQVFLLVNFVLPAIWIYVVHIAKFVMGETPANGAFTLIDVISVSLLVIVIEGSGIVMWGVQLVRARRRRLLAPNRVYVE